MNRRLYRSRDERVISGVAGGLADYLDLDPSIVRLVWVLLTLFSGGAFLIVYIVMAVVVPEEPWESFPSGAPAGAAPPEGAPPPGEQHSAAAAAAGPPPSPAAGEWQDWRAQRADWRAQRRAERAAMRARGEGPGQAAGFVLGLILLTVGGLFLLPVLFPGFALGRWWPLIPIVIGLALVVASFRPRRSSGP